MVSFKLRAMISLSNGDHTRLPAVPTQRIALAAPEGERHSVSAAGGQKDEDAPDATAKTPAPATSRNSPQLGEESKLLHLPQMQPESSPWSFQGKLARAVWMLIGQPLFRFSFHNWYRYRRVLLRLFGARIGKNVAIRPSAHIEIPWMLEIEDGASIGDDAIIYSLGPVKIGQRAIISQYAHLCAGTHDYTDHTFRLIRTPISIGDDCWIGTDSFIGPGVTIGTLTVIGARSSVYKDMPPGKVCVGNPAKPIKDRLLR
jgi:putative colanic acid biosynthesis acetyltransferase WcaF